jgi:molybdopterin synthase sulfur carrier subunit
MKAVYFAWVRERIGKENEEITPPAWVTNVGELITWLSRRGESYAYAFENPQVIRAAIDQTHVQHDAPIGTAREVAFFPPMTGG